MQPLHFSAWKVKGYFYSPETESAAHLLHSLCCPQKTDKPHYKNPCKAICMAAKTDRGNNDTCVQSTGRALKRQIFCRDPSQPMRAASREPTGGAMPPHKVCNFVGNPDTRGAGTLPAA